MTDQPDLDQYGIIGKLACDIERLARTVLDCRETCPGAALEAILEIHRLTAPGLESPESEEPHPMLCVRHGGSKSRGGTCPLCLQETMNLAKPFTVTSASVDEAAERMTKGPASPAPVDQAGLAGGNAGEHLQFQSRISDLEKRLGKQPAHTQARLVALEASVNCSAKDRLRLDENLNSRIDGLDERLVILDRVLEGRVLTEIANLYGRIDDLKKQQKLAPAEPGEERGVPPVADAPVLVGEVEVEIGTICPNCLRRKDR